MLWFVRCFGSVFVVALTLGQTACEVTTLHPLSNPQTATFDERLFGEWRLRNPADEGLYTRYFVGRTVGEVKEAPKGLFVIHSVSVDTREKTVMANNLPLYGFSSKVDSNDFLNVVELKKEKDQPLAWEVKEGRRYIPIKYVAEPNRLTIWLMDRAAATEAVEGRKLEGKVYGGMNNMFQFQRVFLTETTENLRDFIEKGGHRTLFNDKNKQVLDRVK